MSTFGRLSQKPEADMPRHDSFMPQHAKAVQKSNFPGMPRHGDADKTKLFLASRVLGLLCNTTFFVSIKRK